MRPDERELDEEIRGHIALSVKERIEGGEDPEAARRAAWREFGYVPAVRDSMHRVWYSRWFDAVMALGQDMRVGLRSLMRAKGLAATVVVTLALGIGANAAIFSVVREVLLRPLVNRDQDRLIYIRQTATGLGGTNATFSVPEIDDFKSRIKAVGAFGDFSTVEFTMIGFDQPRVVKAGVVSGSFFEVMGLEPILGRLITASDDGPDAAGVAVLTHRFWSSSLNSDPAVIGKTIRLGALAATVVGVLEPSVPYPAATEIIANVVTSPHHLSATMVTGRTHRMTELFGRLAPGATLEGARAELLAAHAAMKRDHPGDYSARANLQLSVSQLRDQIAAPARTVLILLLAAAGLVFVIACSNVANLILARSVRREGELIVRAALGASTGALRRTLLAESLVLCGAGAALGVLLARPTVSVVGRYASRFSVRALDVTVDSSVLWVGAGLAIAAAIVLAYVPRLPGARRHATDRPAGFAPVSGLRMTAGTNNRLRAFAVTQIALSFMLLAGAGMLLTTLISLQHANTGFEMQQVLAVDVPGRTLGFMGAQEAATYREITRRVGELPGVHGVALGSFAPWRDSGSGPRSQFAIEGYTPENGEENPFARLRMVSPGYFSVLGVPLVAGRDFTDEDRRESDRVVIVSRSVAQRLFGGTEQILNRHMWWTDPVFGKPLPRRVIGVVEDVDDESVVRGPSMTVYHPLQQLPVAGRLFVNAAGDPYALVAPVRKIIHELSADQPVERPATLEDIRAEVLAPIRLNAFVFTGFAGVAMLIAVVGVAGVLAFSVSARTREFGVRLAIGSTPRRLL
ncbi:MAG TPA: ABC transporter permease, partial [Vicinamibacterales bacterium]|nr:ABC transporter permease [Vicinamibacterales bacterium]